MTSNPPNHRDRLSELVLKKLGEWPCEKPVQTIKTKKKRNESTPRPTHKKSLVSSNSSRLVTFRGLYNQGMTCALNSVLQTLFMTHEFRQMIISEASMAKSYYKSTANDRLYVELGKLFDNLQYDKWASSCSTEGFTKALGWTRNETGQQRDAHTVFRDILTALQGPPSSSRYKQISDIFHTELEDWTVCTECGDTIKKIQPVSSLNVAIQGHTFVEGCLGSFFNNIDQIPGFACQKCDKLVTVTKRWQCSKVAPILAVNLMRFQQNGSRVVKLNDSLSFNIILPFDTQNVYALYAVINHSGTVDGGHYYAYIRDPPQDQWFEFNDSMVRPLTHVTHHGVQSIAGYPNYELVSPSAYILFYKKIGPMLTSAGSSSIFTMNSVGSAVVPSASGMGGGDKVKWHPVFADNCYCFFVLDVIMKKGQRMRNNANTNKTVLYYEVRIVEQQQDSQHYHYHAVGLSMGYNKDLAGHVGQHPNSYGFDEFGKAYYVCGEILHINGKLSYPPISAFVNGFDDVYGFGLLVKPNKELAIFGTINGMLVGPQVPIQFWSEFLYPTVSISKLTTKLEANFGNDPTVPFRYDIANCPGLQL